MTITITQMYIIMPVLALAIVLAWHFVPVLWGKKNNHQFIPEGYKEDKELKAMVRKVVTPDELKTVRKNIKKAKVKHKNAMLELAKKQKDSEGKAKKPTKKPSKK